MMTQVMVQNPGVGSDSCMKSVNEFQKSIEELNLEGWNMLVMVIPGAGCDFHGKAKTTPTYNDDPVAYKQKQNQISQKKTGKYRDWQNISLIFEHNQITNLYKLYLTIKPVREKVNSLRRLPP
jgi:hypothetical protein